MTLLADYSPELVQRITGVPRRRAFAGPLRLYGQARCATIVYGLGVTEHAHGTDGVRALQTWRS